MTRILSCTVSLILVILVDAKHDRPPDKKPKQASAKLNLSGDWKSSCGYIYTIKHDGIAIEFHATHKTSDGGEIDGRWVATGAVDGKTINVVWLSDWWFVQTWRYIGRYQLIDGKLIGVWGRSDCLYWDTMGQPHGRYTRDVLTSVPPNAEK